MPLSLSTTMGEAISLPELDFMHKYLMYLPSQLPDDFQPTDGIPLNAIREIGWSPEGVLEGLNFLLDLNAAGRSEQYFIYEKTDIDKDADKADVNLLRLVPEKPDAEKPFILLCAGGAYHSVCTMVESLPSARHMVNAGYQVFLLTYRIGKRPALMNALDDLAAAMRYISAHGREFDLDPSRYAMGGFSAGGNLISTWGVPSCGYKAYGIEKPMALFPIYAFFDLSPDPSQPVINEILPDMLGDMNEETVSKYNIIDLVDIDYPPCYIVCGRNDTTVPCEHSVKMKDKLDKARIPAELEIGQNAPHGFGDGTGYDTEGWPIRALRFLAAIDNRHEISNKCLMQG